MTLTSIFARLLSLTGHKKRKKATRALYRKTHDDLRTSLGMEPIQWREER